MASSAKAIFFGALLHILLFAIAAGLVYLLIDQSALSEAVREGVNAPRVLAQHRGRVMWWLAWSGVLCWLISSGWVVLLGNRRKVSQKANAGMYAGGWVATLGVTVAAAVAILFLGMDSGFFRELALGSQLSAEAVGFGTILVAFWLSTGLFVKPAMQGAVPGAAVLPSIG